MIFFWACHLETNIDSGFVWLRNRAGKCMERPLPSRLKSYLKGCISSPWNIFLSPVLLQTANCFATWNPNSLCLFKCTFPLFLSSLSPMSFVLKHSVTTNQHHPISHALDKAVSFMISPQYRKLTISRASLLVNSKCSKQLSKLYSFHYFVTKNTKFPIKIIYVYSETNQPCHWKKKQWGNHIIVLL